MGRCGSRARDARLLWIVRMSLRGARSWRRCRGRGGSRSGPRVAAAGHPEPLSELVGVGAARTIFVGVQGGPGGEPLLERREPCGERVGSALGVISCAESACGDTRTALATAECIDGRYDWDHVLGKLARVPWSSGRFGEALRLRSPLTGVGRARCRSSIARAQGEAGVRRAHAECFSGLRGLIARDVHPGGRNWRGPLLPRTTHRPRTPSGRPCLRVAGQLLQPPGLTHD